jgi:hypothetical protein
MVLTRIRVSPSQLRQSANEIDDVRARLLDLARSLHAEAGSAPSYDGQFGPQVRVIGVEGLARGESIAAKLEELSEELERRAEAFEVADQAGAARLERLAQSMPLARVPTPVFTVPEWAWELLLSFFVIGDLVDIARQLWRKLTGQEVDSLVLWLAILGLAAEFGHLNPSPSGEDIPNAVFAALKGAVKDIPSGPAREALEDIGEAALRNPDEAARLWGVITAIGRNGDLALALGKNADALVEVLGGGEEAVDLVTRYGDEAVELVGN